jgi:site-specific DNA recombinase
VVERIREIGRDPALVAETVRQAKKQREELVSSLETEEKALRRELRGKRARLKRVGPNGHDTSAFRERVTVIEARLVALPGEIRTAKRARIDEADVRGALEAFGPVWDSLWPEECTRTLGLLVEGISHHGREKRVEIRLRAGVWGWLEPGGIP